LSQHCFLCHGPDAAVREAGLRLDDFSYNVTRDPVHVHDLNATILHCLGIDHERLTFRSKGRQYRLTDVHGEVVKAVLA
jgi:hypothetical protein